MLRRGNKEVVTLLTCTIVMLSATLAARAAAPPGQDTPAVPAPTASPTPSEGAGTDQQSALEVARRYLDRNSATITFAEPATASAAGLPALDRLPPGVPVSAHRGEAVVPLVPAPAGADNTGGSSPLAVSAATSLYPTAVDFEGAFPAAGWGVNVSGPRWGKANCNALQGSYAGWPARDGSGGVDPCADNHYPNNLNSWLVFGPFSLAGYRAAELGFFFRLDSELNHDELFWGASNDGGNWFYGSARSGAYTSGPYANGYNLATLNLAAVPTLGDLTGQSGLYIAIAFQSDSSVTYHGPFIDVIWLRVNAHQRQYITDENFESAGFPYPNWLISDNNAATGGEYWWQRVNCYASSGAWSLWPAAGGADSRNPCAGSAYPNNAAAWAIYGPFSLAGASEAWVDFHYRIKSQSPDALAWMASADGSRFYGYATWGDFSSGPYGNGHNLGRFYLDTVPTLGDLRGRSQVWLAYVFQSDSSSAAQGPFLDDVSVVVERPAYGKVYLPVVKRAPVVAPRTTLYVQNATGGVVYEYRVYSGSSDVARCTNIPGGSRVQCGAPFAPGTYQVAVNTAQCGRNSGQATFSAGDVVRTVRCVRD